jgi:anti-anti-sigma factor
VFRVQSTDRGFRVRLSGEWDLTGSGALRRRLTDLAHQRPDAQVELDLAKVTAIDASTLGVLAQAAGEFERGGGRTYVTHASAFLRQVLVAGGLAALLEPPSD